VGLKYTKNALVGGAPPRTPLGEHTTLPRPLVGWGGGYLLSIPYPLGAFGASILALLCPPPNVKSGYAPGFMMCRNKE